MALVKYENRNSTITAWSKQDKRAIRHKLPDIHGSEPKPVIDYAKLKQLISINGLSNRNNPKSTPEAHKAFIDSCKEIFIKPEPKKGFPIHTQNRSLAKTSESYIRSSAAIIADKSVNRKDEEMIKNAEKDTESHDIRDYLPLLHHERRSEKREVVQVERIRIMRRLLKKLPFERTALENDQLLNCVKSFPDLSKQVPIEVLKELCVMAYLDVWKEPQVTVFGNTGWHIILKGSVKPLVDPYQLKVDDNMLYQRHTPEPKDDSEELQVGDCFGTLKQVPDKLPNSRILTVMTLEPNCEFMKMSCSDFDRVMDQIHHRDRTEKVNLLQSCKTFLLWSRQPLLKVAERLDWVSYPPNTVIASEGYVAPYVGIIKSGECHVLRQVEILHTLANGNKERRLKQVVIGKLGVSESFGEISTITQTPISFSIITTSPLQMGKLEPNKIRELDSTTRQLLQQSANPVFGKISQDDIHEEYVNQEMKREWNQFKHNVVIDVINSRGIRPGYGKWAK